jgi:RHS repeat-associated protein
LGEYVYDGDGKRIQVTEDNMTTTYIYASFIVLYEENTTGTATYIYGPTGALAKRTTINEETNTFYYHTDRLGSTRLITDSNKNIVAAVTYHPFGELSTMGGIEHYLFNRKEKDSTGLYYYGARYYDPDLGRFISRDPFRGRVAKPQSLNRYTYCLNSPLKYIDLWGQDFSPVDPTVEEYLSDEEDLYAPPEIIGDPIYENKRIKLPTTDGEVVVFDDCDDEEGGSWSDWKKKAYEKREEKFEKEAERLQALADALNAFALALGVMSVGLAVIALIVPFGGFITAVASIFIGATAATIGLEASAVGKEAARMRKIASTLDDLGS